MRVEVRQIWEETSEDKTGWELVQPWITLDGYEVSAKEIVVTDTDKYGHPTEGYYEKTDVLVQEIRIGNIFLHNSNWSNENEQLVEHEFKFTADHWYWLGENLFDLDNISPVPLTEEWLLKFGFVKQGVGNGILRQTMFWYKGLCLNEIMRGKRYRLKLGGDPLQDINIDFVHDLQNIVFALKKVELEVNV